jgi:hypothetical protein
LADGSFSIRSENGLSFTNVVPVGNNEILVYSRVDFNCGGSAAAYAFPIFGRDVFNQIPIDWGVRYTQSPSGNDCGTTS